MQRLLLPFNLASEKELVLGRGRGKVEKGTEGEKLEKLKN